MIAERVGRTVARNFLALGAGEAAARLVAFGATVYLARTLGASMFGIIGFSTAVLLYISRVADFGVELSGARDLATDPGQLERLAGPVLLIRVLIAALLIALTALIAWLALPYPDNLTLALYAGSLLAVAAGTRWIYIGLEKAERVATARIIGEAVMALLVITLVHGPRDVLRAPLAQVTGDTCAAVLLIAWLLRAGRRLTLRLDWSVAGPLLKRAWPLVLSALLGLIIYNSDLIFLRFFRDARTVGFYAAAYTLISFLVNLGLSYRVSLLPTLTRLNAAPRQQKELYHAAAAHVFAVALPLGAGGFLIAPKIIDVVFGPDYAASIIALQLLIWSVPLCLLRDVPSAALLANAREDQFFRLTAWGAALNLLLNVLLIPRFGMVGAGLATVATEAVRLVIAVYYVRGHGFTLGARALFGRVVLATAAMSALLLATHPGSLGSALALGVLGYAVALVALGGIRLQRGQIPALNV